MKSEHILVIRLSALGDVALTIPVLLQLLQQNPQIQITVLTQEKFAPLFESLERIKVYPVEVKGRHQGVFGLFKLFLKLKKQYKFDAIADLHNVLRSKVISFLFKISGTHSATIDKGRREKKSLTSRRNKKLYQLKTSFQRYADVFNLLGFGLTLNPSITPLPKIQLPEAAIPYFSPGKKNICIAPFARHPEKMYPLSKMKDIIKQLLETSGASLFLLGGGYEEISILKAWEKEYPFIINLAGQFSLREELAIISNFDLMISMDSANMHLASLYAVPVISIWGATHPFAGFYGWGQLPENSIQTDLYCRPCSVFGNKPCYRGDHACMQLLPEEKIVEKILGTIREK